MLELKQFRKYKSRIFDIGNGQRKMIASTGHTNYKGTDNSWKNVDFSLEDKGDYWQMVKASYKIMIAKDFKAEQLIKFQNKYRGASHEIVYEPEMLAWVNKTDLSDIQVFRQQQASVGEINEKERTIFYKNAFGKGLHFRITLSSRGFRKDIIIDDRIYLEKPPTKKHKLVAFFKHTGNKTNVKSYSKARSLGISEFFEEVDGFRLQEENAKFQSFISPAIIEDSEGNSERIKVFWKRYNGNLYQAKVLPTSFLINATYPVMADTVTEIDASVGGYVNRTSNVETWATIRDHATAEGAGASAMYIRVTSADGNDTHWRNFDRGVIVVDLSSITGSIISAKLLAYCWALGAYSTAIGDPGLSVTGGSLINESTVQTGDYDGWNDNEYTTREDFADQAVDTYTELDFNSAGITYLDGVSNNAVLFLRHGYDIDDSEPSNITAKDGPYIYFRSSATAGYEPSLEITYSEASTPQQDANFFGMAF